MRKYLKIATTTWDEVLAYRLNVWLEAFGNLLTILVVIVLWIFAFKTTGAQMFGGYTQSQMISYLLLSGFITSAISYSAQGDETMDDIREGRISNYLVKPIHFSLYYFARTITRKAFILVFGIVTVAVLLFFFRGSVAINIDLFRAVMLFIFLLLGIVMQFLIFYSASLFAFWMEQVWGVTFIIRVFADVAAGAFLPLSLFSPAVQSIFNLLPFRYFVSVPVNIALGKLGSGEILAALAGAGVWLFALLLFTFIVAKRGVRHYSAVGG